MFETTSSDHVMENYAAYQFSYLNLSRVQKQVQNTTYGSECWAMEAEGKTRFTAAEVTSMKQTEKYTWEEK